MGAVRTRGEVRNCFNYIKAVSASSDHTNISEALSNLKKGKEADVEEEYVKGTSLSSSTTTDIAEFPSAR